jgi:hypothetical protein
VVRVGDVWKEARQISVLSEVRAQQLAGLCFYQIVNEDLAAVCDLLALRCLVTLVL